MEIKGSSVMRPVGLYVIVQRPWFGGSWVKLNFAHYGVVVGKKCRDGLTLFLTLFAVNPPITDCPSGTYSRPVTVKAF
jgi:hypothetical protein